jgi:predicted negative regulator of RcsB-dependent stress response
LAVGKKQLARNSWQKAVGKKQFANKTLQKKIANCHLPIANY